MNILVTGGAGYIGSAAVKALADDGNDVVVIDNLSKGLRRLIDNRAKFYQAELSDLNSIWPAFEENDFDAVMHFAAYKSVEESMENAEKYSDNLRGTLNLLDMMQRFNVKKIIYSSSAAVYGLPDERIIDEDVDTKPINYYGYTKLASEDIIRWYSNIYRISYICLRYFNVAGDFGLNYMDPDAKNILPIIMEVVTGKRDKLTIFGNDYDTKDGTCVRDYIDIHDLINAHVLALNTGSSHIINLGTERGTSVLELVNAAIEITGKDITYESGKRRAGDPAYLTASNKLAKKVLGWKPKRSIKDMIKSTYEAYI